MYRYRGEICFYLKPLTVWQELMSERHGAAAENSGVPVFPLMYRILFGKLLPLSGLAV